MTADVIDLKHDLEQNSKKLAGLCACSRLLMGEQFQFVRMSYGDELTLHLGNLRAPSSPKLKMMPGSYIIGVRASSWMIKTTDSQIVTSADSGNGYKIEGVGKELSNKELEASTFIMPGSRVISAIPFPMEPYDSIGLQLQFTDGSTVLILPRDLPDEDDALDDDLPEIADWEITMPEGHLSVGVGMIWSYTPRRRRTPTLSKSTSSNSSSRAPNEDSFRPIDLQESNNIHSPSG